MFDAVAVGHELSARQFVRQAPAMHLRLITAQQKLAASRSSVVIIICGIETSGRNRVVNRLNSWLDPRGVQVTGYWRDTEGELERPPHWRYWRRLPPRGHIGILFGAWHEPAILGRSHRQLGKNAFAAELQRIIALERMLADDGAILIKLWFHLTRKEHAHRMRAVLRLRGRKANDHEQDYAHHFSRMLAAAEAAIHSTDSGAAPWHLIDAADAHYRDMLVGHLVADAIEQRLQQVEPPRKSQRRPAVVVGKPVTVLDAVDLTQRLSIRSYEREMKQLRVRLNELAWHAHEAGRSQVFLFEGWDGSGKGGAIRRVVNALDARLTHVIPVAAPTDEERAQHYLWRFWRQLPPAGYFTIYDRSWYGRVLVERIEGYATPQEWERAYGEINDFEAQLTGHGIGLTKFWMHISKDEQLRRFREREEIAFKRYKITPDDWRNRKKWRDYELAVDEMVARTSTTDSPWTLIPGNCKQLARVLVMRRLVERMELDGSA